MNAAVGHMDGSALMVIGVSAWYPDSLHLFVGVIEVVNVDTCAFEIEV